MSKTGKIRQSAQYAQGFFDEGKEDGFLLKYGVYKKYTLCEFGIRNDYS